MQILPLDVTPTVTDASSVNSTSDDGTPEATVKAAKSVSILAAVYTQANATLTAIRQTAAALDAVEKAAEAVERAKGQHDDTVCFSTFSDLLTCAHNVTCHLLVQRRDCSTCGRVHVTGLPAAWKALMAVRFATTAQALSH